MKLSSPTVSLAPVRFPKQWTDAVEASGKMADECVAGLVTLLLLLLLEIDTRDQLSSRSIWFLISLRIR